MKNVTIEELKLLSVVELKAMVYDEIHNIEKATQNRNLLNQLIAEKEAPPTPPKK